MGVREQPRLRDCRCWWGRISALRLPSPEWADPPRSAAAATCVPPERAPLLGTPESLQPSVDDPPFSPFRGLPGKVPRNKQTKKFQPARGTLWGVGCKRCWLPFFPGDLPWECQGTLLGWNMGGSARSHHPGALARSCFFFLDPLGAGWEGILLSPPPRPSLFSAWIWGALVGWPWKAPTHPELGLRSWERGLQAQARW